MQPCICSVVDRRRHQNVVRIKKVSVTDGHSYHILTSSVIFHKTDIEQHGIHLLEHSSVKPWSRGWLIVTGAYPGFCSTKWLEVFLLPLDGMLVYRRSFPAIC